MTGMEHAYHTTNAHSTAPSLQVMDSASRNAKNVKFLCLSSVSFSSFSFFFFKGKQTQKNRGKQMYRLVKDISRHSATHIFKDQVPTVCNYST